MAGEPETIRVLRPEDLLVLDVTLTDLAGLLDGAALQPVLAPNAPPPGTPTTAGGVRPAEPPADGTKPGSGIVTSRVVYAAAVPV